MAIYLTLMVITTLILIYAGRNDKELDSPTLFLRSLCGGLLFPFVYAVYVILFLVGIAGLVIDKTIRKGR